MGKIRIFRNVFKKHSLKDSFSFAVQGIVYLVSVHRNMRIIFIAGLAAVMLGFCLKLEAFEFLLVSITICIVFLAEMFNTAIELIIDMFTDKYHTLIKIIKDISAGVVLIASVNALVVAYFVYFPKIVSLFK